MLLSKLRVAAGFLLMLAVMFGITLTNALYWAGAL